MQNIPDRQVDLLRMWMVQWLLDMWIKSTHHMCNLQVFDINSRDILRQWKEHKK